jgi:soluble lytic murein transglycosylase-like protein
MLFVPHAGKAAPKLRPSHTSHAAVTASPPTVDRPVVPLVEVMTAFTLPADLVYEPLIQEAAAFHDVDPNLVRAVIRTESAFDAMAVSSAGAQGLMQLMPALAVELGVLNPFDPRENIFAGVRYLRALLDDHKGDEVLALASYNAGPGAVMRYGGVPPYPETQHYVRTITGLVARDRAAAAAAAANDQ